MKAYAEMGVQVQVTEFDIQAPRLAQDWNKASQDCDRHPKGMCGFPNCTAFNQLGVLTGLFAQ